MTNNIFKKRKYDLVFNKLNENNNNNIPIYNTHKNVNFNKINKDHLKKNFKNIFSKKKLNNELSDIISNYNNLKKNINDLNIKINELNKINYDLKNENLLIDNQNKELIKNNKKLEKKNEELELEIGKTKNIENILFSSLKNLNINDENEKIKEKKEYLSYYS